jgi:hypothetical protein
MESRFVVTDAVARRPATLSRHFIRGTTVGETNHVRPMVERLHKEGVSDSENYLWPKDNDVRMYYRYAILLLPFP